MKFHLTTIFTNTYFEVTEILVGIAYRVQQSGNDRAVAIVKKLQTSGKLFQVSFYVPFCQKSHCHLYWFLYISYSEAQTGLMKEYGHIKKTLLQHKPKKIQVRELHDNKQDFALNPNKQLLIATVISKHKVYMVQMSKTMIDWEQIVFKLQC